MADLQFNEGIEYQQRFVPRQSFLTRLVLKTGIVGTERGAQYVLLGVAVVCATLAIYLTWNALKTTPRPLNPFELEQQRLFGQNP